MTHVNGPSNTSSLKDRATSGLTDVKSRLVEGFGRVIDAVEPHIDRAPANLQPTARKAVATARERPLLTMTGLALGAFLLTRRTGRR